jgi:hypothetical protein
MEKAPMVWVPVCCERVMRYNVFGREDGGAFATMRCQVCAKSFTFEQEIAENLKNYGERASVISLIGTPRPPTEDRTKTGKDSGTNDPTL